MTSIIAASPEFYTQDYFNILEQYEYDCLFLEYTTVIIESFDPVIEELNGDLSYNKRSRFQRFKDKVNQMRTKGSDKTTKGEAFSDKIKTWFKFIGERLREIIQKFVDKVDELFSINKKFIEEQGHNVVGVDDKFWADVKITVYPYDKVRIQKTIYENFDIPKIDSKGDKLRKVMAYDSKDDMIQNEFKAILKYKDQKDSFTDAVKKYYRNVKGINGDLVQLEGSHAKAYAIEAYNYVKTYKEYTAKTIRDSITELKGAMERINRDFQNNKLADYISENAIPVIEENDGMTNGAVQSATDSENGSTLVNNKDAGHVGTRAFARIKQYSDILMQLLTAKMTIAEEYYFASIHVLKALFSKARKEGYIDYDKAKAALDQANETSANKKAAAKTYSNPGNVAKAATNNR